METISIVSFNCRYIKSSVTDIYELCNKYDIIALQETWLMDFEQSVLGDIHPDFYYKGVAAVRSDEELSGRPYGGIAFLWHKKLGNSCKILDGWDSRIISIEITNGKNKIVLFNVYLPYCCRENLDEFLYYISKVDSLMKDCNTPNVFAIGDFNADVCKNQHLFGGELLKFCTSTKYILSDVQLCSNDTFTFFSEAHSSTSWLDHIMSTHSSHQLIENVCVLYDFISSDHHPVLLKVKFPCDIVDSDDAGISASPKIKWDQMSEEDIGKYSSNTEDTLKSVIIDHELILCDDPSCKDPRHISAINRLYTDIVSSLKEAGLSFLKAKKDKPYNCVPGWNDYCKQAHSEAREAYYLWRCNGRPRYGDLFNDMKRSRSYFKYVIRKCKNDKNRINADKLAMHLLGKSDKLFWKEIKKLNQSNAPIVSTVDGVTGTKNVTEMWKTHFEMLLNSSNNTSEKDHVLNKISGVTINNCFLQRFTVDEVKESLKNVKNGKTCGLDSIYGEHLKFAHNRLHVLLSLLFNAIVIHGYIPLEFMDTLLVPLIKDKNGNLSDKNNYRPLAITCIISKLMEIVVLNRYKDKFKSTDNQFGFKNKLSTELCIYSLKQITDYYVNLGSPMYLCFLDASKAFDKINHWILFKKLIDRKFPILIIRMLVYWYTNQRFFLRWNNNISSSFTVSNGVRQGSILSPYFFNIYLDELSLMLSNSKTGCIFNGVRVNHLFYADDAVLLAPSPCSLQSLLDICQDFARSNDLVYNTKKTFCICVKPKWLKDLIVPSLYLGGDVIKLTPEHKYLGMFISNDRKDDLDIKRQVRGIYARGNALLKRFKHCNDQVKVKLFNSYCSNFYCSTLWYRYSKTEFRKLKSAYNRIFRNLFNVSKEDMKCSMVTLGVKTLPEILRNLIYGFSKRILLCDNEIIIAITQSTFYYLCPISKHWKSQLTL